MIRRGAAHGRRINRKSETTNGNCMYTMSVSVDSSRPYRSMRLEAKFAGFARFSAVPWNKSSFLENGSHVRDKAQISESSEMTFYPCMQIFFGEACCSGIIIRNSAHFSKTADQGAHSQSEDRQTSQCLLSHSRLVECIISLESR
jgi:hypothetical protein